MSLPKVKVCCISSLSEAQMAREAGADYLGLVSEMPSGPGVISLTEIKDIVAGLPSETKTILLTSKLTSDEIIAQHNTVKTWGIQLVDTLPPTELLKLKKARRTTALIQVIHVRDNSSLKEAQAYQDNVDFLLLDSGNPEAKIKTLGGTGATHDWGISREICQGSELPVFLAGGLNPENISDAITHVKPSGVDLCSGVRSGGYLDKNKLQQFMNTISNLSIQ